MGTKDYILIFCGVVLGWLVFVGSLVGIYSIIQTSHKQTPQQQNYITCMLNTDAKNNKSCEAVLRDKP